MNNNINEFYEKIYQNEEYHGSGSVDSYKFKQVKAFMDKHIKNQHEKVYLDVGCSSGIFLTHYVNTNKKKYGIDISATALKKCQNPELLLQQHDFEDSSVPFALETFDLEMFDVITMMDFIEHVFDPKKALQKARCLLKNNGYVVLTIPNDICYILQKIQLFCNKGSVFRYENNGHIRFFNTNSIKDMLEKAGFVHVTVTTYGHLPLQKQFPNTFGFGYIAIGQKVE